jgi:TRAP-type C4-dicarboxylate transport system permease small subunit
MESLISGLRALLKGIRNLLAFMLVVIVIFMTFVMFSQIVMRAVGMQSFKWSEEVLRYSYIWIIFLGVPVGIYSNDLTRFDLIQEKLSPLANKILETVLICIMLIVLFFMAQGSFTLIGIQMRQMMTSLSVPMGIIYLSMPVCAICSMLFLLTKILLMWLDRPDLAATVTAKGENDK